MKYKMNECPVCKINILQKNIFRHILKKHYKSKEDFVKDYSDYPLTKREWKKLANFIEYEKNPNFCKNCGKKTWF